MKSNHIDQWTTTPDETWSPKIESWRTCVISVTLDRCDFGSVAATLACLFEPFVLGMKKNSSCNSAHNEQPRYVRVKARILYHDTEPFNEPHPSGQASSRSICNCIHGCSIGINWNDTIVLWRNVLLSDERDDCEWGCRSPLCVSALGTARGMARITEAISAQPRAVSCLIFP